MTKNGQTYYYHLNGHGDVVALTDNNGNVVAEYEYDAWRNILHQTGPLASENPYRYAGYRYDEVTGLYYLMARYYDADMGRFLSRDSFHGLKEQPLDTNLYAYTRNNPVMHVDPEGHYLWLVAAFARGAFSATYELLINHIWKYRHNPRAMISKFPLKKFATLAAVGGLMGIYGGAMSRYITKEKIAKAGRIAWDLSYAAKEYIALEVAGGGTPSMYGLLLALKEALSNHYKFLKSL
jgi:RHS repeat-associated protein